MCVGDGIGVDVGGGVSVGAGTGVDVGRGVSVAAGAVVGVGAGASVATAAWGVGDGAGLSDSDVSVSGVVSH